MEVNAGYRPVSWTAKLRRLLQFRLSTALIVMLITSVLLGLNFSPKTQPAYNVETYGWPFIAAYRHMSDPPSVKVMLISSGVKPTAQPIPENWYSLHVEWAPLASDAGIALLLLCAGTYAVIFLVQILDMYHALPTWREFCNWAYEFRHNIIVAFIMMPVAVLFFLVNITPNAIQDSIQVSYGWPYEWGWQISINDALKVNAQNFSANFGIAFFSVVAIPIFSLIFRRKPSEIITSTENERLNPAQVNARVEQIRKVLRRLLDLKRSLWRSGK